jgi:RecB family exonuclease
VPTAPRETGAAQDSAGKDGAGQDTAGQAIARDVWLEGRADRLDRAADGSLIVVDFKTGATVPSKAAVAENAQLAVYQLAINLGAADRIETRTDSGSPVTAVQQGSAPRTDVTVSGDVPLPDEPGPDEPPPDEPPPDEPLPDEPPADHHVDRQGVGDRQRAGGAELIYLRSGTPNTRHQPALDPDAALGWQQTVREAAERLASSASLAQENRYCERCPVRASCPLQPAGRQVTR